MVSVDMVGVGDRVHAVDFQGIESQMADDIVTAAASVGIDVIRRSRGDISDHVPFALAGVPAALLWRGDNPNYHQAGDDLVEDEALLENLRILEALIEFIESS